MKRLVIYRLIFFIVVVFSSRVDAAVLSRYEVTAEICKIFWNIAPDESAVLRSGLLESFPDGRIHLDWPVTRGTALILLARVVSSSTAGILTPLPASFTDLKADTEMASAAYLIGACFEPLPKRRFVPDRLIERNELDRALEILKKNFSISKTPPEWLLSKANPPEQFDLPATGSFERRFPLDFKFEDSSPLDNGASDAVAIDKLKAFVPEDQLAPQDAFDLTEAGEGMTEIETLLDSLDSKLQDLMALQPAANERIELLKAFDSLAEILDSTSEKLHFSLDHLKTAVLTDPVRLRETAALRTRMFKALQHIEALNKTLNTGRLTLKK